MRRMLLMLVAVLVLMAPAGVRAADDREADHKELTALRETTQKAINTMNFDILKPYLVSDNLTVVTVDGKKCESLSAFSEYWNKLFRTKEFGLDRIEVKPVADGPTEFLSDTVGICHGTSNDQYYFKSGDVRSMPERWTAVVLKDNGVWKVSRIIFSANILENPVVTAVQQETGKAIAVAGLAGLVLGILAGWLLGRMKKGA